MKRLCCLALLLLGALGVVGCAALTVGVWIADARVSHTAHVVFEKLDDTLSSVHGRVVRAEQRVDEAALTTNDLHQSLEAFAKRKAIEQVRERLDIDGKAKRLAGLLEQADGWMETSEASIEVVRRAMDMANEAGAAIDSDNVDRLLEELDSMRSRLQGATELVDSLRDHPTEDDDVGIVRQRLEQAARLALRIVAALGVVQSRLQQFSARIDESQRELNDVESRTIRWIHTVAVVLSLLLVWMLAGQLALCRYAWLGLRG